MLIDLKDKVTIITGAGRGIGNEIAKTFAAEGAIVVVTDIRQDLLDAVKTEWDANGWRGMQCICDVRDSAAIKGVVDAILAEHGRIDVLINNAGVSIGGLLSTLSEEAWDLNQDVNLKGTFLMCQAVIPTMKAQKSGRIINAASFAAIVPIVGGGAYAASKSGVHYFTRALAGELGPWDITVNCYAPGMIPTEINHFTERPQDQQDALLDTLTLRRWGSAADVANLLAFLASDLAGYITGTMIDVSGGKLATQIPNIPYKTGA